MSTLRDTGPETGTLLQRMGIETPTDLFAYYPLRSVIYPELMEIGVLNADDAGMPVTVCVELIREPVRRSGRGIQPCTDTLSDDSGEFSTTQFHTPYLRETLRSGRHTMLFGKIQPNGNRLHSQQP